MNVGCECKVSMILQYALCKIVFPLDVDFLRVLKQKRFPSAEENLFIFTKRTASAQNVYLAA